MEETGSLGKSREMETFVTAGHEHTEIRDAIFSQGAATASLQPSIVLGLSTGGVFRDVADMDENEVKEGGIEQSCLHRPQALMHDARKISFIRSDLSDKNFKLQNDCRFLLGKQAETYRQEVRQQQIQKWVLKHNFSKDSLPSDCWPDKYPQSTAGCERETVHLRSNLENGKTVSIDNHGWAKSRSTRSLYSDPSRAENTRSSKRRVHFAPSNAILDDSGILPASEVVSMKRRKVASANEDNVQGDPHSFLIASPDQPLIAGFDGKSQLLELGSNTTLRHWLNRPCRVVDRFECLHIFKQILEFVDLAHAQGVVLRNVRPSSFILSSLHRVSFLDSASSRSTSGTSDESTGGAYGHASFLNMATISEEISTSTEGRGLSREQGNMHEPGCSEEQFHTSRMGSAPLLGISKGASVSKAFIVAAKQDSLSVSSSQLLSYDKHQQELRFPDQPTHLVEETWYASPEETSDGTCTYASDIYSLGVLFFELFCSVNSWDEYSRLMADLRHRILPPRMLSERPKEAAFCLLLLHPDPRSRPSSSEIMHSEILNEVGEALVERQTAMGIEEKAEEAELLLDFLRRVQQQKQDLAARLKKDLSCLTSDIQEVKRRRSTLKHLGFQNQLMEDQDPPNELLDGETTVRSNSKTGGEVDVLRESDGQIGKQVAVEGALVKSKEMELNGGMQKRQEIRSKCARLMSNFDQLEQVYFAMRWKVQPQACSDASRSLSYKQESKCASSALDVQMSQDDQSITKYGGYGCIQERDYLGCFFDSLSKYARYSRFEVKATLRHGDLLNTANMVCSLGFDRDQEYFATAGVCKRIKVFECDAVLNENVDIHYPVIEMPNKSMLSSICWNSYVKSHIASSDYDGIVKLWDASTGKSLMQYEEHEKRAWSVDFSQADPTKLASGSDDGCVKIWSINQEGSVGTIKTNANVCCIQFPKESAHLLAFGSADYKIYCYDLRNTRIPWFTLSSHTKTVSYVKFLDSSTLVSASTDNTLKLWDLSRTSSDGGAYETCQLTYTGHTNEKNFVGLSVMDGYIACGSETNAVFAYHKSLPMPMASHKFGCMDPFSGHDAEDDTGQFVSSVCWRGKSQTLVAANSKGNIKVLDMV